MLLYVMMFSDYRTLNKYNFLDVRIMTNTVMRQFCRIVTMFCQGCTNPWRQVAVTTKCCTVALNICGFSVWNLLHVTPLAPRIFWWLLDFMENFCIPVLCHISNH